MKTVYKFISIVALGSLCLAASAQKDTLINRQVMIEREYNPILNDASRIDVVPYIYEPTISKMDIRGINTAPQVKITNKNLGSSQAGDIENDIPFDTKRGYLIFGAGSNMNIDGAAGYRLLDSKSDRLDFYGRHTSASSDAKYVQKNANYPFKESPAKYYDTKLGLKYAHTFAPSILSAQASYMNTSFNYYGNAFDFPFDPAMYDQGRMQNIHVINFGGGIRSSEGNTGLLRYNVNAGYSAFGRKRGVELDDKKMTGGLFNMDIDFNTDMQSGHVVGIKGYMISQSMNNAQEHITDALHSLTNITATPYIKFEGENWTADLGVNVSAVFDVNNRFAFTPNAKADIRLGEKNILYGQLAGGVNNNTFLDILVENRYTAPSSRTENSKTLFDAKIGFKSGVVSGFEFDVFGGYSHTEKDHLYLTSCFSDQLGNMAIPVYANVGVGQFGGVVKTNLIPYTDLSAKLTSYFYNVKYVDAYVQGAAYPSSIIGEKKAWGRPSFVAELTADVKPIDRLVASLSYKLVAGRTSYLNNEKLKMDNINELNFKAEARVTDWASINVRLNNLLFQKYDLLYGYPAQGFSFMGGVSLKF